MSALRRDCCAQAANQHGVTNAATARPDKSARAARAHADTRAAVQHASVMDAGSDAGAAEDATDAAAAEPAQPSDTGAAPEAAPDAATTEPATEPAAGPAPAEERPPDDGSGAAVDADAAAQQPPAEEPSEEHTAASGFYDCERGCGFRGTFDEVEAHEDACAYDPDAPLEEEGSQLTAPIQLDLSELFNASALTNLFQGLQHQLKHQQARLASLEVSNATLEAARLEHVAEREIWEVQQAELSAQMERDKRMMDRRVRQAVRESLGGLHSLQTEINREKGMKRLCAYVSDKEMAIVGRYYNSWKHNANQMTVWLKKKRILMRLSNIGEKEGLVLAWTCWLEKHKVAKHDEGMKVGFERLIEVCYERQVKKKAFHQMLEVMLHSELCEAVGHDGDFSMEPDANQAEIFRIAERAARPYINRATKASESLKFRDAFENCQGGFMATLKVLEAEDDMVQRKEERKLREQFDEVRASLATIATTAEARRVDGMVQQENALKTFVEAHVASQVAAAVSSLDTKFDALIATKVDALATTQTAHFEGLTERCDALEALVQANASEAMERHLGSVQEFEDSLSSYGEEVTALRSDLRSVAIDVVSVDKALRGAYEDLRKHVLWEVLQRRDASDASQAWVRAALGHHLHEKTVCTSSTKGERTAAFMRDRAHIAASLQRILSNVDASTRLAAEGAAPPTLEIIESGFVEEPPEEATTLVVKRSPEERPAEAVVPLSLEPPTLTSGFETGRVKGSVWDELEVTKQLHRGRLDALRDELDDTSAKLPKTLGAAPNRPLVQRLCEHVFAPYEDLVKAKGRLVTVPSELAYTAAHAARALSDHVAAAANLEELVRVTRGTPAPPPPEFDARTGRSLAMETVSGLAGGPDGIANRRVELVREFVRELQNTCVRLRPGAGALRLEARVRFVKRFHEACDSALSVWDQVIAEAPTLMGRGGAACVACNRPLSTKVQREPRRDDAAPPPLRETRLPLTEVQQLLASRGPELPRPLSTHAAEIDATQPKAGRTAFRASKRRPQSRSGRVAPS